MLVTKGSDAGNCSNNPTKHSPSSNLPTSLIPDTSFPVKSCATKNSCDPFLAAYACMEHEQGQIIHSLLPSGARNSWIPVTDAKVDPFSLRLKSKHLKQLDNLYHGSHWLSLCLKPQSPINVQQKTRMVGQSPSLLTIC
jgi:hypothetical protein